MKEKIVLRWKKSGLLVEVTYTESGYKIHYNCGTWGGSTGRLDWVEAAEILERLGVAARLPKPDRVLSRATKYSQVLSSMLNVPMGILATRG